ncbi:MAG: efflux RND transporter periplasmic adaptor subunit [Opitutales bacterium]|nr:efflux RND transporter periplasmic adaptor subunit [Opitutales bacterium]
MLKCPSGQRGKRFPRLLRTGGLAGIAVAAAFPAGCGGGAPENANDAEAPRTPVAAVEIVRRDLSRQLDVSGTVEPLARVRLATRAAGTLRRVHVEEGDTVKAGDVLAELDVAEEEAELEGARAREEQARLDFERIEEMFSRELVSTSEFERARTDLRAAQSEGRLWEARVGFGRVTAPVDAVVTARYVEPGEGVDARHTVFELMVMDKLVVRVGVSELDVGHLERGRTVSVRLDALPDAEMEGTVRRVFPSADGASRLVTVEVALPADAATRGVRPGYLARVRASIDRRPDALAVPAAAVGEEGDDRYVYVIDDGYLRRRGIEPGATRGQWTEVLSGLEEGEIVLATNPIEMGDGEPVRIVGWRG